MNKIIVPGMNSDASVWRPEDENLVSLFPEDALAERLRLVHDAFSRSGGLDDCPSALAQAIERSMTWGTTAEVGLRLVGHRLPAPLLAKLDALATVLRICRGIGERRAMRGAPLVESLVMAARFLAGDAGLDASLIARHEAALERLWDESTDACPWTATQVDELLNGDPTRLAAEAAQTTIEKVLGSDEPSLQWAHGLAWYGECKYLCDDLATLVKPAQVVGIASPVSSLSAMAVNSAGIVRNGSESIDEGLVVVLERVDRAAFHVHQSAHSAASLERSEVMEHFSSMVIERAVRLMDALQEAGMIAVPHQSVP